MPKTIPHRELRNNSSAILREVQSGETFQITNHGEVVAVLTPRLAPWATSHGFAARPTTSPFSAIESQPGIEPTQVSLDELRGER
ncbi:MAG: type II toxin-antitoxin system prevent-host-death family antitoxin [Galbitalea sp.]